MNKLTLPAAILIASLIFGGFYYATQTRKQRSVVEQEKKEYVAKRKNECYSLYEKERAKWDNVADFRYSEVRDVCVIRYKSSESARPNEECEKIISNLATITDEKLRDGIYDLYWDCLENHFSKVF